MLFWFEAVAHQVYRQGYIVTESVLCTRGPLKLLHLVILYRVLQVARFLEEEEDDEEVVVSV